MIEDKLVSFLAGHANLTTWFPDATNIHPVEAEERPGDPCMIYALADRQETPNLGDDDPLIFDTFDITLVSTSDNYATLKAIETAFWDNIHKHRGSFGGGFVQAVFVSQAQDRGYTTPAGFEDDIAAVEFQLLIRYTRSDVA